MGEMTSIDWSMSDEDIEDFDRPIARGHEMMVLAPGANAESIVSDICRRWYAQGILHITREHHRVLVKVTSPPSFCGTYVVDLEYVPKVDICCRARIRKI